MNKDLVKNMKKNNRILMMVLTVTILLGVIISVSYVVAQEGDPQAEDDQSRNCLSDEEGNCLRDTERSGDLDRDRDRDCDGDIEGDPLRNRAGDLLDAELF